MTWDGIGRRDEDNGRESLRDIVISQRQDTRNFIDNFNEHKEEDTKSFDAINKKLEFHQKIVYGGMGIVIFLELIIKVTK